LIIKTSRISRTAIASILAGTLLNIVLKGSKGSKV
jgi:hypothetical protein